MTAKEKLRAQIDELSEAAVAAARIVIERTARKSDPEADMAGLPEPWRTFDDGTPVPNWVAGLDEVRAAR